MTVNRTVGVRSTYDDFRRRERELYYFCPWAPRTLGAIRLFSDTCSACRVVVGTAVSPRRRCWGWPARTRCRRRVARRRTAAPRWCSAARCWRGFPTRGTRRSRWAASGRWRSRWSRVCGTRAGSRETRSAMTRPSALNIYSVELRHEAYHFNQLL